jgi:hypothetical protein
MKFLLASMKSLTNPLQRACSSFLKAACVCKSRSEQKFDAAYGAIFRISKCFQRSNQTIHIISLKLGTLKL